MVKIIFTYIETAKGLTIIKYNGLDKHVVVLENIKGKKIVEIEEEAFKSCSHIKSIDIKANLTEIGYATFQYCSGLQSITLPETLVKIGPGAFDNCESLEEIIIPNSVTELGCHLFSNCTKLKSVKLPNGIDRITNNMFYCCYSLEEFEIPNSVETIEQGVFYECENLKKIIIPEGVTTIETGVFSECNSLEEITLPKSLVDLDNAFMYTENIKKVVFLNETIEFNEYVFSDNKHLEYITISVLDNLKEEMRYNIITNILLNKDSFPKDYYKELITAINNKNNYRKQIFTRFSQEIILKLFDENIIIPIQEIENYLELSIKNEDSTITAKLLDYKNKNFTREELKKREEMKELVKIGLEYPTLEFFEESWYCTKVEGGIKIIGYKGDNTTVNIPKQLADGTKIIALGKAEKIDFYTLDNEFNLRYGKKNKGKEKSFNVIKKLKIDADITLIDDYTFSDCEGLEEINIPDTVTKIGQFAFQNCYNLKEIIIPNSVTVLNDNTFANCSRLDKITLPDTLTRLGCSTFSFCSNLMKVNIPPLITNIPSYTFNNCTKLVEVNIPDNVTVISESAFSSCRQLQEIKLPDNLTTIEKYAFTSCASLEKINIPKSLKNIGCGSFLRCDSLVDSGGFFIVNDILLYYNGLSDLLKIPANVKVIGGMAMHNSNFSEVILPEKLVKIDEEAFRDCLSLNEINFPINLKSIEDDAFSNCCALDYAYISKTTNVSDYAFDRYTTVDYSN